MMVPKLLENRHSIKKYQMQLIEDVIEISRIKEMMPNGVTQPFRCLSFRGNEGIVKFENNRYGITVLLNELIGCYVADLIGVPVPPYGVCHVAKDAVGLADFGEEGFAEEDFLGYGFYSSYIVNAIPLAERVLNVTANCDVNKIILLDCILNNADRHDGNLLITMTNKSTLYAIDFSHIISRDIPWNERKRQELFERDDTGMDFLRENDEVYSILFRHKSYSINNLKQEANNIQQTILNSDFYNILNIIPESWNRGKYKSLAEQIVEYIKTRTKKVDVFCQAIIERRSIV
ncbi:Phosphatidylinositol 3-and 4-kinase [uncultured Eubacterium sp.]|nr:Phosphatidylinositol 3-and 4-kinase [uncultured Eubacterium sp.]